MELKVTFWDKEDLPTEEDIINTLEEQDLRVYHWSSLPDSVFAGHTHGYHKVLYVLEGNIKFEFPARHETFTLNAGDRLDLPAGIRHNAKVGINGVKCLEAHVY